MSNPRLQRKQIEDNILTLARKVNTNDARWVDGAALTELAVC